MRDKLDKKEKAKIALIILVIVLIPWSINIIMTNCNIETASGLKTSDWLGFWGGYIGSAFGVIATLFAFLFTYIQNEKQHRATQQQMQEQIRLQYMPIFDYKTPTHITRTDDLIDIFITDGKISKAGEYNFNTSYTVEIINVGNTAINTEFFLGETIRLGHILSEKSVKISFIFKKDVRFKPIRLQFSSLDGKSYYQILKLDNQKEFNVSISEVKEQT